MSHRPPTPNPHRSPQSKKENLDGPPVDKRRRIGAGGMAGPAGNSRARQVLSVVNAGPGDAPAATAAEGADGAGFELTSQEDVDRLLNEKMKRKISPKKENLDGSLVDKRRRIGAGGMAGPAGNSRARQVLSVVNAGPGDAPAATAAEGADGAGFELTSQEDVDRLLNEKMKGKSKLNYKGKSEQMAEYIRKLRICIKWLTEREDADITELEKLRALLDSEEKRHAELEAQMRSSADELNATIEELRSRISSLEESCRKEETDKMAARKLYEEEKLARSAAECSRDSLSFDLHRAREDASSLNVQIKALQENNRRMQEYNISLQQCNSNLQDKTAKNIEEILKLNREKNTMVESLNTSREMQKSLASKLEISKVSLQEAIDRKEELKKEVASLGNKLQQVRGDRDWQVMQVQSLLADIANYKELTGKSAEYLDKAMAKSNALEVTCSSQSEEIKTLQHQLAVANEKLKSADVTSVEAIAKFEEQKKTVEQLQARIADAENQLIEAEKLRKKLHNTILELKGNIRVFCRVRPILTDGDVSGSEMAVSFPKSTELSGRGIELNHNAQKYSFSFDKVFTYEDSQEDVFVEISQLVQSALDGYKVCIFAYGQTGSGKTYTMMGRPEAPDQKGVIPRSLEQIFHTSQSLLSQGWKFKMQASMLEIYNETIRDLLATNRPAGDTKHYGIKHDANGNTYVSDLTIVDVSSIKEVSFLLKQAAQSRSVGKTQMNEQSSRSHFVFTLRIFGYNEITEQQVQGVLNLIDLAGSERLAKSGATGDRLKETQAINKSLSTLSDVIFAIAKKEDHIPFWNSKLTYLLQPCLGGDSKTLMFVNISPEQSSTGESKSSLLFAARVNSCEIGIPRRQTQTWMRSDLQLSNA